MFDLEKFKTGKYYVHLPTRELFDEAMEFLDERGVKWNSGRPSNDDETDRWSVYEHQTYIRYDKDYFRPGLIYGSLDFYKEKGYKQLGINKFEKGGMKMFDLEKFKTGNYYVHLPTQELYDEAMEFLAKNGFIWGESKTKLKAVNYWIHKKEDTSIISEGRFGVRYDTEQYYIGEGYKKLELNMEENMEGKIRRDFIKLMFEKEFKYAMANNNNLRHYKGRIISDYGTYTLDIIDFIDYLNKEYGIRGDEVAKVVIDEFELDEIVRK